jgi:hypothetical protein
MGQHYSVHANLALKKRDFQPEVRDPQLRRFKVWIQHAKMAFMARGFDLIRLSLVVLLPLV